VDGYVCVDVCQVDVSGCGVRKYHVRVSGGVCRLAKCTAACQIVKRKERKKEKNKALQKTEHLSNTIPPLHYDSGAIAPLDMKASREKLVGPTHSDAVRLILPCRCSAFSTHHASHTSSLYNSLDRVAGHTTAAAVGSLPQVHRVLVHPKGSDLAVPGHATQGERGAVRQAGARDPEPGTGR
jgi:hypothetical protein